MSRLAFAPDHVRTGAAAIAAAAAARARRRVWFKPVLVTPAAATEPEPVDEPVQVPEPPRIRVPAVTVIRRAVEIAAEACEVKPADVLGPSRTAPVLRARFAALAAAWHLTGWSSVRLGRWFNRDHASVLHARGREDQALVDLIVSVIEEEHHA